MYLGHMLLRLLHSRGEVQFCCCSLIIWNMQSSLQPCRLYPWRNHWETSYSSFLVKASWHALLICPLAEGGKKRGKLDSIENRNVDQRAAELEAGAGIEDSNL